MADDPNKKGADAKRISKQPHEQAYQRKKKAAKKTSTKGKGKKIAKASKFVFETQLYEPV